MMRNYQETSEVEESNNASTDSSVENEVNTNVPEVHRINKESLFGLELSDSSEVQRKMMVVMQEKILKELLSLFLFTRVLVKSPMVLLM
eukprot:6756046-Ditylum_brightwellii.AAC.1